MSQDWPMIAAAVPLLAKLPRKALATARMRTLPAGATLFRFGHQPRAMHAVLDGEIRLLRRSADGLEIVLQRARRGFLAEASLDQPAYHCDAVAACDARVLAIPLQAFRAALDDKPFRVAWMAHLARELRSVRAIAERASLKTARARVIHYIETEGKSGVVELTQSKKDWAAELGLTHEALYRELAKMKRRGEIDVAGAAIRLTGTAAE
jgi:CRP/FNR family transcriptional regulator, dissimilatory nitrate respiration regulator